MPNVACLNSGRLVTWRMRSASAGSCASLGPDWTAAARGAAVTTRAWVCNRRTATNTVGAASIRQPALFARSGLAIQDLLMRTKHKRTPQVRGQPVYTGVLAWRALNFAFSGDLQVLSRCRRLMIPGFVVLGLVAM